MQKKKEDLDCYRTQSTTKIKKKQEKCKLDSAIFSRKENLQRNKVNAGLPLYFLLLLKRYINGFFFSAYVSTEGIKQRFEQIYYMIYCSVENALVIGIKRGK